MTETAPGPEILPRVKSQKAERLVSLDVFRGLVIVAMLIVNNLYASPAGYFWKHAEWVDPWPAQAFSQWWHAVSTHALTWTAAFTEFPLWKQCTLADYVMPWFMLIIGLAIPYSAASMNARGLPRRAIWKRLIKRTIVLIVLGWILCYFRDQFTDWLYGPKATFHISLGMDVLQLLGVGYFVARIFYELPGAPRLLIALALFIWHWAFLRFWPQGAMPAGTFMESAGHQYTAAQYAYDHWPIFRSLTLIPNHLTLNCIGLLSVPPAAATMLLGTLAGDCLRRADVSDHDKASRLFWSGALAAAVGLAWSFDLPFNKPRWTPCYLLWTTGVGLVVIAFLYWLIDIRKIRRLTYPFIVFGTNALAVYWLSIMGKVLLLNTPRVHFRGGTSERLVDYLVAALKHAFGFRFGGWAFTLLFITFWWFVLDFMHRRKLFWKL